MILAGSCKCHCCLFLRLLVTPNGNYNHEAVIPRSSSPSSRWLLIYLPFLRLRRVEIFYANTIARHLPICLAPSLNTTSSFEGSSTLWHVSEFHPFIRRNDSPLSTHAPLCASIHPLPDTWVASAFWPLHNAAANAGVQVSVGVCAPHSRECRPTCGTAGSYGHFMFSFFEEPPNFSVEAAPFTFSLRCPSVPISPHPSQRFTFYFILFLIIFL